MDTATKILLVTGGSRGIGAATASLAAEQGYAVCINYLHHQEPADSLVNSIKEQGGQAIAVQADVGVETDVIRLFDTIDKQLGSITALVNNAGILDQQTRLEEMSVERWQKVLNTNVIGSFLCAREAVKRMSIQRGGAGGAIVNLSSTAARLGAPNEYVDYAASKGAVESMTIGLAKEVAAEGIRVNAVRPGIIDTEIHTSGGEPNRVQRVKSTIPMLRGGEASEVAHAILWLLSEQAAYTTGSFLDIAGGR